VATPDRVRWNYFFKPTCSAIGNPETSVSPVYHFRITFSPFFCLFRGDQNWEFARTLHNRKRPFHNEMAVFKLVAGVGFEPCPCGRRA
jgi:hypothetical protein